MTGEQLAWFVRGEGAAAGNEDISYMVDQLERLHVALEVVVALRTYMNLSLTSLTHFTAQVSEFCGCFYMVYVYLSFSLLSLCICV